MNKPLLLLGVLAAPFFGAAAGHATPINGTATLNDEGITMPSGKTINNTPTITVADFRLVAATGNIASHVTTGVVQSGTTFNLLNLSSLSFSGQVGFTATSGSIVTNISLPNSGFLNIVYDGTATVSGLDATKGTLSVTFTENFGTVGGSNVVAAFTPAPEPASLAILGVGLLGLAGIRRREVG